MDTGRKGKVLVFLQFSAIAGLLKVGVDVGISLTGWILIGLSALCGFAALMAMRKSRFSIFPPPHKEAELISSGVYAVIRHPMYTAVLLFCLGCIIHTPQLWPYSIWIGLMIVLILKIQLEEKLLLAKFPGYVDYSKRTYRLLPFIW